MKQLIIEIAAMFALDFGVPVDHIHVVIERTDKNVHASCWYFGYGALRGPTMVFNQNHWETLPYVHRRELVYHELGHCALNLRHVKTKDIMRQRLYATELDGSNWEELVNRMQRQAKLKGD